MREIIREERLLTAWMLMLDEVGVRLWNDEMRFFDNM